MNNCLHFLFTHYSEDTPIIIILQFVPSLHNPLPSYPSSSFSVQRAEETLPPDNAVAKNRQDTQFVYIDKTRMLLTSEQPDIPEQSNDKRKEDQPLELITRIRELIIHLFRQRSRIADFIANAQSKLFPSQVSTAVLLHIFMQRRSTHILQHANFLTHLRYLLIILRFQFAEYCIAVRTAFIGCCCAETCCCASCVISFCTAAATGVCGECVGGRRRGDAVAVACGIWVWRCGGWAGTLVVA
jgi:hypothetical protein